MYKPTVKDKRAVERLLIEKAHVCNQVICHKDGTFTAKRGYFYGGLGKSAGGFVNAVVDQMPSIKVIDSGNRFSNNADSFFWVKFELTEEISI